MGDATKPPAESRTAPAAAASPSSNVTTSEANATAAASSSEQQQEEEEDENKEKEGEQPSDNQQQPRTPADDQGSLSIHRSAPGSCMPLQPCTAHIAASFVHPCLCRLLSANHDVAVI